MATIMYNIVFLIVLMYQERFLSFYKKIMDAQYFSFYIKIKITAFDRLGFMFV